MGLLDYIGVYFYLLKKFHIAFYRICACLHSTSSKGSIYTTSSSAFVPVIFFVMSILPKARLITYCGFNFNFPDNLTIFSIFSCNCYKTESLIV